MVYGLGQTGHAPERLSKTNKRGVPYPALIFSGVVLFFAAILNYFIPDDVFTLVTTLATIFFIFIWSVILICYIKYRREDAALHKKSKFKNPFGVIGSYLSLIFFAFVLVVLFLAEDTRTALMYSPLWIILLVSVYYINKNRKTAKH